MKRFLKYLVLLILLGGAGTFGIVQYLHSKDRGKTTEEAASAIANAANAAVDWTRDKTRRRIEVIAYFGDGGAGMLVVRATLTAIGGRRVSQVCAAMPIVRDALNAVLFDRLHRAMDARGTLEPAALAGYAPRVKAEINRSFHEPIVDEVRLSPAKPAALREDGCKADRQASRH